MEETRWVMGPADGPSCPPLAMPRSMPAFEALYREHEPRVREAVRGRVERPADVEELTQEVFLHALRSFSAGRVPDDVRRWLDALTRTAVGRWRARASRHPEVPLGALPLSRRADARADLDRAVELERAA